MNGGEPEQEERQARALTRTLLLIALVVAVVGSLGAPLITSVATTLGVSLAAAQWTLTVALLTGAVATPVLGRLGTGFSFRRGLRLFVDRLAQLHRRLGSDRPRDGRRPL